MIGPSHSSIWPKSVPSCQSTTYLSRFAPCQRCQHYQLCCHHCQLCCQHCHNRVLPQILRKDVQSGSGSYALRIALAMPGDDQPLLETAVADHTPTRRLKPSATASEQQSTTAVEEQGSPPPQTPKHLPDVMVDRQLSVNEVQDRSKVRAAGRYTIEGVCIDTCRVPVTVVYPNTSLFACTDNAGAVVGSSLSSARRLSADTAGAAGRVCGRDPALARGLPTAARAW